MPMWIWEEIQEMSRQVKKVVKEYIKYLTSIVLIIALQCCKTYNITAAKKDIPTKNFDINHVPTRPNYNILESWVEHPDKEIHYAKLPKNYIDNLLNTSPKIDVFFVHPTLYFKGDNWNADINDETLNKKIGNSAIQNQASVFVGIANIYAPHYRQMHIHSYSDLKNGYQAYDIAYSDVKNAFIHYWKNYSKSKKFILAGHSQGTNHCERLLKEVILKNDSMKNLLIMSYLPGMPIRLIHEELPPCSTSEQLDCFLSWRTLAEGYYPKKWVVNDSINCVNPISWKKDTVLSEIESHLGILFKNHKIKYPNSIAAYNYNGAVWIKPINIPFARFYRMKNYHIADYNLFWSNIRENLKYRLKENGHHK